MTGDQVVQQTTNALFVLIFMSVAVAAARRPRRETLDAAALFGVLAFVVVAGEVVAALELRRSELYSDATAILVMAMPYLLLRLVDDFHDVPGWITGAAIAGWVGSAGGLLVLGGPIPQWWTLALVAYFGVVCVYASVAFLHERGCSSGVTRRRMTAAALGSLLLGLAVVPAGLGTLLPFEGGTARLLALVSAIAYAIAFATPDVVRRAWREPDLRYFLERIGSATARTDVAGLAAEVEQAAARVLGAKGASLALFDAERGVLRSTEGAEIRASEGPTGQVLREQRPNLFEKDGLMQGFPERAQLYEAYRVHAIVAAPVTLGERPLGVLSARSDCRSLFAPDDLELVAILARQAALAIEAASAVGVLRRQSAELQARVADLSEANRGLDEATRAKPRSFRT